MNAEDLKALRGPLVLLALVIAVAGASVYYTYLLRQQAQLQLVTQQGQLRESETRMQRSGEEEAVIIQYVDKYRELQRAGFVGDEQRVNWLDALRTANERTDLFGINYEIGVQQPYAYAAALNPGQISLRQSIMKLDFRLLHEGDLLRFFDALRTQNTGLFHLDSCVLRRTEITGVINFQPNIAATCELIWITATPAVAGPGIRP